MGMSREAARARSQSIQDQEIEEAWAWMEESFNHVAVSGALANSTTFIATLDRLRATDPIEYEHVMQIVQDFMRIGFYAVTHQKAPVGPEMSPGDDESSDPDPQ